MKYISVLRGINVSGQKKIKMADLKSLYQSLGFQNVATYIQSGNVIFSADSEDRTKLKTRIEKAIEEKYGFHVPTEIRSHHEISDIINNNPLGPVDPQKDGTKVLVTFLSSPPAQDRVSDLQQYVTEPEQLFVMGKEAYLYCPNGYGKSRLSNTFLEKKLGVGATTRNWTSVLKLHELSL
ncbi:MAG TPA: DUF1697 domain-containing protein [Gammaproteobacteria bacterium]|nr:DUF1697 domain-containing protein [Gammaproteobacteria bacterium]